MINHARASGIFAFMSAGYGTSVLLAGFFSGRVGYKKVIITCIASLSLISFLLPFVRNFNLLYLAMLALGFSHGLYIPSTMPLITEYYAEKNWGRAIAIHDIGASTAIFATPLIALGLLHFLPWRGIFIVYGSVFALCLAVFIFAATEVRIVHPARAVFRDIVTMRSLWFMTVLWIFGAGCNLGIYAITPLYLTKELGLSMDYANTVLSISRLVAIGVAVACGFLVDRFSLKRMMFSMLLMTGIFTVLMGLSPVKYTGMLLFFQAFFVTGFFPMGLVAIARTFGREVRSLATGMILAASFFTGGGIVPWLLGVSGDIYSFRLGIVILGVLTVLTSFLVYRLKEIK